MLDRECESCEEGITFNIMDDGSPCHAIAPPCTDKQWQAFKPGVAQDRVCLAHTTCVGNQKETRAAGEFHDRSCVWQQQCKHITCQMTHRTVEGTKHTFVKVNHHHKEHQLGYKYHHCSFLKEHARCLCICAMDHPVDFDYFMAGARVLTTPPPTPPPTPAPPTASPTPMPTPKPMLTHASQCKVWKRLAVVHETLSPPPAASASYLMKNAALWSQGRAVLEAHKAVLLRLTPSGKPRSDVARFLNSTYPAGSALYIFDTHSPFAGKAPWGCGGFCYEGNSNMFCANNEDMEFRRSASAHHEHWVHNGGATQGPCGFGNVNQRWDGNLNSWDICSEFDSPDTMAWVDALLPDLVSSGFDPATGALDRCHGDCDTDADCKADHVCHQRNGDEPVPGCSGTADSTVDYCVARGGGVLTAASVALSAAASP